MALYGTLITARTGEQVPVFCDGRPAHSKYNPVAEGAAFGADITGGFIVIAGIAGGFHIRALHDRLREHSHIIACESDLQSLEFCRQLASVRTLESSPDVLLCTVADVADAIRARYVPALHGPLSFHALRTWEAHAPEPCQRARQAITEAMQDVAADFSVQAHFGKLWQRNILCNLTSAAAADAPLPSPDTARTAAIIAAGPSLDTSIGQLRDRREQYAVIATDTAYGALLRGGVIPELVMSVDGQQVSAEHFLPCPAAHNRPTTFAFDISASPAAIRTVRHRGHHVFLTHSAHPLSVLLCRGTGIPYVETGSGTVAIAACDLARQLGFARIELFGADFCYNSGKPYAKGTYLDARLHGNGSRTTPAETAFSALMYRAPLHAAAEKSLFSGRLARPYTSDVLQRYGQALRSWAATHGYTAQGAVLSARTPPRRTIPEPAGRAPAVAEWLDALKKSCAPDRTPPRLTENEYALLPYIAWLEKNAAPGDKHSFFDLLKLAYSPVSRYTTLYEN